MDRELRKGRDCSFAGIVSVAGSPLCFFAPDLFLAFVPAYGLIVLTETAYRIALPVAGRMRRGRVAA